MSALCCPGNNGRLGNRQCRRRSSLLCGCCRRTAISPTKGRAGRVPPPQPPPRAALFVSSTSFVACAAAECVAVEAGGGIVSAGAQLPVADKSEPERSPLPPRCTRSCRTMQPAAVEQVDGRAAVGEVSPAKLRGRSRPFSAPVHGSGKLSPQLTAGPGHWPKRQRLKRG